MTTTRAPLSLGMQAVTLASATGIAQIIMAVMYIYTARVAGPSDYGLTIAAVAIGTAFVGYLDFGTNSLWVRELANSGLDIRLVSSRARGKLLITLTAGLTIVLVSLYLVPGTYWIAGPVLISQLVRQTSVVPLRALSMSGRVAVVALVERVLALAVLISLTLIKEVRAEFALWVALTVGSLLAASVARVLTPRSMRLSGQFFLRPSFPYRGAKHYGLFTVGVSSQSLDLALLTSVSGAPAAGLYGAVNRWTQPMGLLANAFSTAAIPFVAKSDNARSAIRAVTRGAWLLGLAVVACIFVFVTAPWLVPILIGSQYEGAISVLQILALSTIPGIFNQPLATFLQSIGRDRVVSYVVVSSVALQLALILWFGASLGALGAAYAALAVQSTLFAVLLVFILRISRRPTQSDYPDPKDARP